MFIDKQYRPISCHDTWISIDPIVGCPFSCGYCVLRHSDGTGTRPRVMLSPEACVEHLLQYPLFVRGTSRLAIGNETDILHPLNVDYLLGLLVALEAAHIDNCIALITKAQLNRSIVRRIRDLHGLNIVFFLSYSGLGRDLEPNFTDGGLRTNFEIVKETGFRVVHFWRPLLPENTSASAIETMLSFVSAAADASIAVGLKLHPELTQILTDDGRITVPSSLRSRVGEWLEDEAVERIFSTARRLCPDYPVYRHTSCALARIVARPNHTGTAYRSDVCPSSQCSTDQRQICEAAKRVPTEQEVGLALQRIARPLRFVRADTGVSIPDKLTQEEYSYIVQSLGCPVNAASVELQNLYYGSIHERGWRPTDLGG